MYKYLQELILAWTNTLGPGVGALSMGPQWEVGVTIRSVDLLFPHIVAHIFV